jgi:hypothetical protein
MHGWVLICNRNTFLRVTAGVLVEQVYARVLIGTRLENESKVFA